LSLSLWLSHQNTTCIPHHPSCYMPRYLIPLDSIILIILSKECKLRSSSLRIFLQPIISFLVSLNILLSTMLSELS
jgi:hypothetical protein